MRDLLLSSIILVCIDIIYLNTISNYFNNQIKEIQGSDLELNMLSTVLAYIFIAGGLYYFIIKDNRSVKDAFILGLVIYMIYELTNKGIIKNWKWKTVLIDGVWGGILFGLTTYIYKKIKSK